MKTISDRDFELLNKINNLVSGYDIKVIESEPIKKWEPRKQKFYFQLNGGVLETAGHLCCKYGQERSSEELCKIAIDRNLRSNLIGSWLDCNGSGEQEFSENKENWIVYKTKEGWQRIDTGIFYPNEVYMNKEDATAIYEYLNSGNYIF